MKNFSCKTNIISGIGSIGALESLNIRRLFLVCDPFFAKNGTAETLCRAAKCAEYRIFSEVKPDPSVTLAAHGAAEVRKFQPDAVVALGGGSAIDCAKAMVYFSECTPTLVAVPTTSGSGSEVTDFAVLTHEGVKHPLVDARLRPDVAILDGALLETLPASLVADSGFDLVSHAMEAWVARGANALSDAMAVRALESALRLLPRSERGELGVRQELHEAATAAGIAFSSAGLGLCHALSHALGGEFHVAHGRLNAIVLPTVMAYNATDGCGRYGALARRLGLSGGSDTVAMRALNAAVLLLRRNLRLPDTLAQAGISPAAVQEKLPVLVQAVLADPCCQANPIAPTSEAVRRILTEVSGRG